MPININLKATQVQRHHSQKRPLCKFVARVLNLTNPFSLSSLIWAGTLGFEASCWAEARRLEMPPLVVAAVWVAWGGLWGLRSRGCHWYPSYCSPKLPCRKYQTCRLPPRLSCLPWTFKRLLQNLPPYQRMLDWTWTLHPWSQNWSSCLYRCPRKGPSWMYCCQKSSFGCSW